MNSLRLYACTWTDCSRTNICTPGSPHTCHWRNQQSLTNKGNRKARFTPIELPNSLGNSTPFLETHEVFFEKRLCGISIRHTCTMISKEVFKCVKVHIWMHYLNSFKYVIKVSHCWSHESSIYFLFAQL